MVRPVTASARGYGIRSTVGAGGWTARAMVLAGLSHSEAIDRSVVISPISELTRWDAPSEGQRCRLPSGHGGGPARACPGLVPINITGGSERGHPTAQGQIAYAQAVADDIGVSLPTF